MADSAAYRPTAISQPTSAGDADSGTAQATGADVRLLHLAGAAVVQFARGAAVENATAYRELLQAVDVALYTTDADGRITFYNEAAAWFWGRRPATGERHSGAWRLYDADGQPMAGEDSPMATALKGGRLLRGLEVIAERRDGTRLWFTPRPALLVDEGGAIVGGVNILIDITERKEAEEALRASAEALRESDAVKDEFLGLVSHELRTPVTTVFGNARLLRDRGDRISDADRDSMVGDIAAESERLLGLIENLLLLTRLDSGMRPDAEPQVLAHVVKDVVDSFSRRHPTRQVLLHSEPRHLIVEAEHLYLELLLDNLLSNADKYSPPGAAVEVMVRAVDGEAQVVVLDRGIGLTTADAARLFSPFYRTDEAKALAGGLGIGLAACRRVVETLGGRVWAAARAGGGSAFGFALPPANVSEAAEAPTDDADEAAIESPNELGGQPEAAALAPSVEHATV